MANPHRLTTDQVTDLIKEETDVNDVRTLPAGQRKRRRGCMGVGSADRTLVDDDPPDYRQVLIAQVTANARNDHHLGARTVVAR
ncbi:MAG: hypothetical protein EOP32_02260 [Rhodococcus sp. (in: high G+C Gram-positive bacteria)]|nr:MAG: hypothetical protein EOP32_02260 [Rhodococcus sp. (in: high G+C Gram-positive bacteria)]